MAHSSRSHSYDRSRYSFSEKEDESSSQSSSDDDREDNHDNHKDNHADHEDNHDNHKNNHGDHEDNHDNQKDNHDNHKNKHGNHEDNHVNHKDNHDDHGLIHEHHYRRGRSPHPRRHSVQAYGKQHGKPGHKNQRRGVQSPKKRHRPMQFSKVEMPTGFVCQISQPVYETLKCGKAKLINLRPKGAMGRIEFSIVEDQMQQTIMDHPFCKDAGGCFKRYNIIKIQKIIQGCVWRKYQTRKLDVAQENGGHANERMLFHGTPHVWDIIAEGFDERKSNPNGKMGAGLYFTTKSSAANQFVFGFFGGDGCRRHKNKNCYICERKLLLCRVTLGKSQEFLYSSLGQMTHPDPGYQSAYGRPGEGGYEYEEFVVYRGEQVYPEYLITYTIEK